MVYWSSGTIDRSSGAVYWSAVVFAVLVGISRGRVYWSSRTIDRSTGAIDRSAVVLAVLVGVVRNSRTISWTARTVDCCSRDVDSFWAADRSSRAVDWSTGAVDWSTGAVDWSTGAVDWSTGAVDGSTGAIDGSTGAVDWSSGRWCIQWSTTVGLTNRARPIRIYPAIISSSRAIANHTNRHCSSHSHNLEGRRRNHTRIVDCGSQAGLFH